MINTWRFQFVDINKSVTINETESEWIGYAVIRAPKGQTSAMYIPPNNQAMIEAMFGYASADWPDLYEVIDFNQEYGVYISAPTLDTSDYANYYGGVYLTKQGVVPLYKVSNKKEPNYELGLLPTKEALTLPNVSSSTLTLADINTPKNQAKIEITGVDSKVFQNLKYIDFDWSKKQTFRYKVDKTTGYLLPDDSVVSDSTAKKIVCGSFTLNTNTGKYDFIIGGTVNDQYVTTTTEMNTATDEQNYGIPFIDFSSTTYNANTAYNYATYMVDSSGAKYDTVAEWRASDGVETANNLLAAITNGGKVDVGSGITLTYDRPLTSMLHLIYDIEDDVYAYIIQPSATANKTKITIDNVVYDKYEYSRKLYYTTGECPDIQTNTTAFAKTLTDDGYMLLKKEATGLRVYQYTEDENDDEDVTTSSWKDVTSDYETDAILAFDTLDTDKDTSIHHKIFKVTSTGLVQMTADNDDEDFKLQENIYYNSFHSKSTEEDSEGEIHVSGDFTGSLDEFGVDENGGSNYWEELLPPDDSVVFAEVYVVKTFDDDLDADGIYTGYRIDDTITTTVQGQRYVDYIVEQNIKNGNTGGDVTTATTTIQKKVGKIIKEGLIEAAKPKYEDCSIFMEFTGLDTVKSYFSAIRAMHNTATIISPKNVNSIANCKTITVTGRLRGTAQFVQELQYKDSNLRKKYYACPIGAIGVMLMRIMEDYLGGVAPAWLNEGDVGGQIGDILQRTPLKVRWDFTDDDTKILDQKGLNPILMDADDGVMIVSQRTTEQNAGDWSYLGHSMAFDLCKREIRDNVMKPQLMKKISPHWIAKRQAQVNRILAKRTGGDDPIWSYAASDIASVNNDYTRAQRIFNIPVEVRVYPFSEKVVLSFTNLSQITSISD